MCAPTRMRQNSVEDDEKDKMKNTVQQLAKTQACRRASGSTVRRIAEANLPTEFGDFKSSDINHSLHRKSSSRWSRVFPARIVPVSCEYTPSA